jgi:dienelactone hydrolase
MKYGKIFASITALSLLCGCQTTAENAKPTLDAPTLSLEAMQGDKQCPSTSETISYSGFEGKAYYVPMNGKCFAVFYSGPEKAEELVFFINGHNSSSFRRNGGVGEPNTLMMGYASDIVAPNRAFAQVIRHGHCLSLNKEKTSFCSDGKHPATNYYRADLMDDIAYVMQQVKQQSGAKKVAVVGTSAGSTFAGVIAGRYPEFADGYVLVSCNCTVLRRAQQLRLRMSEWTQCISPDMYTQAIPRDTTVIVLTGSTDKMTPPNLNKIFAQELQQAGIAKAHYTEREGRGHGYSNLVNDGYLRDAILSALGHQAWPH